VKPPKVTQSPTLPFEESDWQKLIEACDRISCRGPYREGNRARMKAMLLLLRATGLRIRDAATLERARVKDGKLFLYTQKTGTPVYVPLPPVVAEALNELPVVNKEYVFWSGNGDPKTTVADWQRGFRRLCDLASVDGHFHMIRDTAAVGWLTKGVPIETVSILLGHSSIRITEKHYAPWVKSRQEMLEAAVRKTWS
jgi:integrase